MTFQAASSSGVNFLERKGSGPILICLHGIGSNATSFDALLPKLPDNWHVLAWNAPGYGGSSPLAVDWPVAGNYAEALKHFVDGLGLRRFHLFGHSLGTLMAAAFAVSYPAYVDRLLLGSCALGHGAKPGGPLSPQTQARLDDLSAQGAEVFAAGRAANLIYRPDENPCLVERVFTTMSKIANPGYTQAVRMLATGRLIEDCARLDVPTSVIVGAEDKITPTDNNERAHAAIPEPKRRGFASVSATGHALYQQAPQAVADFIIHELEIGHA
ncbi:MAG: alpha/beta fold hydrolase [Phyllobacterium sp.]